MPAGLQIIGSHGIAQIDETYKNFVVVASGSKASGDWAVSGVSYFVNIVVSDAVAPLLAFKCAEFVALSNTAISGATWTITLRTNNPAALDYWVFDESPSTSPASVGIEIYNSAGARVYHSAQKPLRVAGTGAGTYTSGRTYAVIRADPGFASSTTATGLPFPEEWQFDGAIEAAKVVSNVVTAGGVTTDNALVSPKPGVFTAAYIGPTLVIDVTYF